jgi:DNA-binding LacI/PurR family transcriptional regulator
VDQKMLEVGTMAAGVLVERVQGKRHIPPETITLTPELRPRITSGGPAG